MVPGWWSGGISRNPRTGSRGSRVRTSSSRSRSWPLAIEATCRSVTERLWGSVISPSSSGKCDTTVSSRPTRPSSRANPSAVAVKLLLSEYSSLVRSAVWGAHHPSATTCPWRTTIRLCSSIAVSASTASTNASTAAGSTPWSAGALRGRSLPTTGSLPRRPAQALEYAAGLPPMIWNSAAALAGALGVAAGVHSLVRLGRAGRRRHRLGPGDPGELAEAASVVVPARDEAGRIGRCVAAILGQDAKIVEVVVVDDGSRDATAAEAAAAGARVVAAPAPGTGRAGKAAACAVGGRGATAGRWLAFVDADVVLAPQAISRLLAACLDTGAVAASPLARQATRALWEELLLPDLGLAVAERLDLDAVGDPAR